MSYVVSLKTVLRGGLKKLISPYPHIVTMKLSLILDFLNNLKTSSIKYLKRNLRWEIRKILNLTPSGLNNNYLDITSRSLNEEYIIDNDNVAQ